MFKTQFLIWQEDVSSYIFKCPPFTQMLNLRTDVNKFLLVGHHRHFLCVVFHRIITIIRSILLQQCSIYIDRLVSIVFAIGSKWLYSCCGLLLSGFIQGSS